MVGKVVDGRPKKKVELAQCFGAGAALHHRGPEPLEQCILSQITSSMSSTIATVSRMQC